MGTALDSQRLIGIQMPIQAQSTMFVAPWEVAAGPTELAQIARTVDGAGYDYLGVCDHVVIPEAAAGAMSTHWMDPISTLGWLAARTERVKLLTHVFVLAYRHPLMAAKQFATLDHLSGGRLIAGIGAGHLEGEFDALGLDFASRGSTLNESLPTLIEALENEFVGDLGARPRPAQMPRPPIWIAGSSAPALRRAAQFGDGWLPQGPTSVGQVAQLRELLAANNRELDGFVIGHITRPVYVGTPDFEVGEATVTGSADEIAETLLADTPEGVNQMQLRVIARSVDECCDQLERVADSIIPTLR